MRRRRAAGAGAAARAALLAVDREVIERCGHLMHPAHRERTTAVVGLLENGEEVEPIPGWRINAWIPGVDPWAFYRISADDSVIAV